MLNTNLPIVSVVIPVYNRFKLAKEAITSVITQTYQNIEIIIVDDGSTDMTPVLETYFKYDSRVRYLRIKHSGMPGLVRNRGSNIARGKYIAFLDSDDLWEIRKLERQIEYFANNPACKVVHTREIWIRNGKTISQSSFKHRRSGNIFKDSLKKCIIGPSTVLIEKKLYEELGGFMENLEIAEDYELWLRLANSNNPGYIDEPLISKRAGHGDQLSEKYGHIEIFRIKGLQNLIEQRYFSSKNYELAVQELARKCQIYAAGCRKRDKLKEAVIYESIAARYGTK